MHRRYEVIMERYLGVMVAVSESVMKNRVKAPPGRGLTMTSYPIGNKTPLSHKPCVADKKLLWNAIWKSCMVALTESVMENRLKRPLAAKSR